MTRNPLHVLGPWLQDVRLLGSKNNVQCKDKWRNLELAVTRNLPMRGLVLTEERRERVLELAAKEAALSAAPPQGGEVGAQWGRPAVVAGRVQGWLGALDHEITGCAARG